MVQTTSAVIINRLKAGIGNRPWTALGATAFLGATGYRTYKDEKRLREDAKKRKVLVVPFHRMKIVEEKKSPMSSLTNQLFNTIGNNGSAADKVIEVEANELVSLIHEAARDPSIVSLYGIFGSGGAISTGGWAHLEEIRNALEKFATESSLHQVQESESSDTGLETKFRGKTMYAYSNTFGGQQSMKDYYLASVFPRIHLQPQGDLELYGLQKTDPFLRGFLKKYGIKVQVWKHGAFKNMANIFTHSNYSKEHYENTAGILLPIHKHVCKAIFKSRQKQLGLVQDDFGKFWRMVENAGSFPAGVAHQIGFVDHLPLKNPLDKLIKNNKQQKVCQNKKLDETNADTDASSRTNGDGDFGDGHNTTQLELEKDSKNNVADIDNFSKDSSDAKDSLWKLQTDSDNFTADSQITIDAYAQQKAKLRHKEAKDWKFFKALKKSSESNSVMEQLLSLFGYSAPYFNIDKDKYSEEQANGLVEKIAVIKINGTIGETTARKAEKALRKVKSQKEVKCVILRIDSPGGSIHACESLYQEIQDIPQKVVVSFGNVSASGGYYIASSADQIFASSSTITGSIGVVMMRMDFRELAKKYGITFDSIPTSALSGSNDPFYPINNRMNENFANQAVRSYHRFKSLVSKGRELDMKKVESIAKGRVWTGEQAHRIGLVDEIGGLDEAIAFAQRNYTLSGGAQVVSWPPKKSFWEFLSAQGQGEDTENDIEDLDMPAGLNAVLGGILNGNKNYLDMNYLDSFSPTPTPASDCFAALSMPATSGIMLTVDENTAVRCMLEEASISEEALDRINHIM